MAKDRTLSLTAKLIAAVDRTEPEAGLDEGFEPLSDADHRDAISRMLRENGRGPFHIFAYGSLIWKRDFKPASEWRARAHGWRRSFCIDIANWRATAEQPGLMMALDRGGCCDGVVLELREDEAPSILETLVRREASYKTDLQFFRWLKVRNNSRTITAYTFYAAPRGDGYFINLPIAEQAKRIARAAGHWGSNAAYLHNTVVKLQEFGISDAYLWRLQELVADEIRMLHPHLEP